MDGDSKPGRVDGDSKPGRLPAYAWVATAAAACGGTTALILLGHGRLAGVVTLGSLVSLLAARRTAARTGDPRADFATKIVDRVHDASVLAPLAWVARRPDALVAILALVGLGAAFVASYERARAGALGFQILEQPAFRALLSLILAIGLLALWIEGALWVFTAVTLAAVAVRGWTVATQYRRAPARPA